MRTKHRPTPAIQLVGLAGAQLGCKMGWQCKPIQYIILELEYNAIDATLAFSVYPMKGALLDASLSLFSPSYDFCAKQSSTLKWDSKQFNRMPHGVGANAGYFVAGNLSKLRLVVQPAPGDMNNLGKLVNGSVEANVDRSSFVDRLRGLAEFRFVEKLEPSIVRKDFFWHFQMGIEQC